MQSPDIAMKLHVTWRSNPIYLLSVQIVSVLSTKGSPLSAMVARLVFVVLFTSSQGWAQNRCESLFSHGQLLLERQALAERDLSQVYADETTGKTRDEIAEMNANTIAGIVNEVPGRHSEVRATAITEVDAAKLLKLTLDNPVVTPMSSKYDQPGVSIGYCFGRATFIHLMLLKMGLQKSSIRKIWAVGAMKAGPLTWQFHVATMAYTETLGWVVLDTNLRKPMPVREWIARYASQNEDGRLRIYATDASKFAFQVGKYSRVQMGLDLTKDQDWYRHYFKDMMTWLSRNKLADLGLKSLNKQSTEQTSFFNMTMSDVWRSAIEFLR